MDLIGEIVEHEVTEAVPPSAPADSQSGGFPVLATFKRKSSRFRQKPTTQPPQTQTLAPKREQAPKKILTEAEKIHEENMQKILALSSEEIAKEREELLLALDPKLIQTLLKRAEEHSPAHESHSHAEGFDGWIGGGKNNVPLPHLDTEDVNKALGIKSVKFNSEPEIMEIKENDDEVEGASAYVSENAPEDEDALVEDINEDSEDDEVAPEGYQIVPDAEPNVDVHFPKPRGPTEDPDMDINDPNFFDKLHEKYYPDLPKETSKLAWMKEPLPQQKVTTYEAISDMRFDFKGDLVELNEENAEAPAYHGLHHHSDNPQLPGYTLAELLHFSRSVVPTQRCLGIQTLGRILHKLGLHKYNIAPIADEEENPVLEKEMALLVTQFEDMMWELIDQLRIIDSLTEATQAKNLSVKNYAIEALWLWKQGGGRPKTERPTDEEVIAEHLQNM
ncbi:CIC11C00000003721 [Sungouiella intermedia]|uniref:CIC11C00000003721 n=1 Tax=Sungouiella intermedia TaxID=45354 RepID=A0A1L0BYF5_9ASCO|nr:CIC11C00000003721 [[Candida] intermedia]